MRARSGSRASPFRLLPPVAVVMAVCFGAGAPAASAQARIHADVDTTLVTVGDRIALTLSVDHPVGSTVVWPDSLKLAPFEVVDARVAPAVPVDGGLRSTASVTLAAFELGDFEIPSLQVEVRGPGDATETLRTDRFGIEVVSVSDGQDGEGGDIHEIRGPLAIAISTVRLAVWVLLALLLGALAWFGWRWWRRAPGRAPDREAPMIPARPPHEVALEELAALAESPLLERGQIKEFHTRASEVVRTYIEARYRVPSLEMTSAEVVSGLLDAGLEYDHVEALRRFLDPCDMVKFAKVRPDAEESARLLALGRAWVEASIPEREPVTAEAVAEGPPETSAPSEPGVEEVA